MDNEQIEVPGTTVPFFTYTQEGIQFYEFDTSLCQPPEPMVNMMRGLQLLDSKMKRSVMINMQEPTLLYSRLADDFSWEVTVLENGDVKIIFSLR